MRYHRWSRCIFMQSIAVRCMCTKRSRVEQGQQVPNFWPSDLQLCSIMLESPVDLQLWPDHHPMALCMVIRFDA